MIGRRNLVFGGACLAASASHAQVRGSVSGRVVDENGTPLPGVRVEAVYQTVSAPRFPYGGRSIKAEGTTDREGRYRLSFDGLPPGLYSVHAYQVIVNGPHRLNLSMVAAEKGTFGSHETIVRDFRRVMVEESEEFPYGNAGVFVLERAIMEEVDLSDAEVTLVPEAGGRPIVRRVRRTGEGLVVTGIPFGTYRATVRLGGRPLRLQLWGSDADAPFRDSIVHDFTMGALGNQFRVFAMR